ncbi:hypothetical protein Slin14017_G130590 [Septoria linicola]|nr:hypothetical protein Slin14017_G130590 [Septoria linicola]
MSTSLPDCAIVTPVCTSCLFAANYTTVDPPFIVTATATYTPTIVVDVTTFANGSSTTNTVASATEAPQGDSLTWESDGFTFTYGTTYLNYTSFFFATPSSSISDINPTLACFTGEPDDITTTQRLLLPTETVHPSLLVTLTPGEPLPTLTVPAQILSYLDTLPTVSEQLDGRPLSLCSPTTTPIPSCTFYLPSSCPAPSNIVTVTKPGPLVPAVTVTVTLGFNESSTVDTGAIPKRQSDAVSISYSIQISASSSPASINAATPSSPAASTNSAAPSELLLGYVEITATPKSTMNKVNLGPASISVRRATSLSAEQAAADSATSILVPVPEPYETSSGDVLPVPPPSSTLSGAMSQIVSPTQGSESSSNMPDSPTAPAPVPGPASIQNTDRDIPSQPADSDSPPSSAESTSPPDEGSPSTAKVSPQQQSSLAASVSSILASISSVVASASNAAATDPNFSPESLASINSAASSAAAEASEALTPIVPAPSTNSPSNNDDDNDNESDDVEVVVYTTTEPYTTGYTTTVVTETRDGNAEGGTTGVGDYIESGLGNSGGSGTESARPAAYTGMANRVGVVDVRGLFGMGVGWMGWWSWWWWIDEDRRWGLDVE